MISSIWKQSRALTVTAGAMLVNFIVALLGVAVDPRMIGGAAAWMKPAKFGISTAIFAASIAWLFQHMPAFGRSNRWVGWALAVILNLEVGLIDFQEARGTTSHFNVGTVENAALWGVMGVSIGILLLLCIWIVVALFRQPFKDPVWGWALRLAMLISVLGSASGGLMTMPTSEQRASMMRHERPAVVGGHTVGAPDGGPGIAGVGWSKQHGDLRIGHFLGPAWTTSDSAVGVVERAEAHEGVCVWDGWELLCVVFDSNLAGVAGRIDYGTKLTDVDGLGTLAGSDGRGVDPHWARKP